MKFTFPPESKPLPGFTLKRAIHRGGFGEVYYGLSDAGKEVALKLLHQHTDVELRGATACLNLNHPNLVTIYDIKQDADGDHWIVMEYVGGKRLADLLEERRTLPVEEIERWLDGMAAGLHFLHERGIVHRDLKPSNVFSENGVVKVGDVGLSKFISESRRSCHTQSVGTVYYMAPEVARGRYGREVDVYALGVIVYEMLTGEVPFDGESTGEILMKHLSQPPDLSKIPNRLRPVLSRALEKDPQRRTNSVDRLRDEFKAAVRGRFVAEEQALEIPEDSFLDRQERLRKEVRSYSEAAHVEKRRPKHTCGPQFACGSRKTSAGTPAGSRASHKPNCTGNWTPFALIGGLAMFLMFTRTGHAFSASLWEAAILAALAYGAYSVIKWGTFRAAPAGKTIPVNAPIQPVAAPVVAAPQVAYRRTPLPTPDTLRSIAARDRAVQFTGSMTVATLAATVLTGALAGLGFLKDLPSALLFGGTATFGSWALLASTKVLEGRTLDNSLRRLALGTVGLVVGLAAYGLDRFLLVDYTSADLDGRYWGFVTQLGDLRFAYGNNEPALAAYMAFFGMLFLLRRWWWQTDAYRSKRLRIGSVLFTALLGYVLTALIYFPHVWGIVWAVAISCIVQLSAAWTPPADRRPTFNNQPAA